MNSRVRDEGVSLGVGVMLVLLGLLFLLEQFFDFRLGQWMWPFFIIIPGLLCFVGMILGGKPAGPLAIPGSIVTTVGLLLLYQNTFNHFESWAYAWALIPVAVGIGLMIYGAWSDRPAQIQNGRQVIGVGLVLFLVGFFFFELILNISGIASGIIGVLLLIAAGLYLLTQRLLPVPQPAVLPTPAPASLDEPVPPVAASEVSVPEDVIAAKRGEQVDIHGIV